MFRDRVVSTACGSRRWGLAFCRLSRRGKPANAGDPLKAHGWSGAPKRSEVRSGTLGNVGRKCEPADAGDRSPASGMHCRSSDSCQAVSSGRFAGFGGSRDLNPAFRVSGRSTLGFRRVARAAGLHFLRLRGNDLPNTKPEKCGSPIVQAVVSWKKAHERPHSSARGSRRVQRWVHLSSWMAGLAFCRLSRPRQDRERGRRAIRFREDAPASSVVAARQHA
jgi:hypothetical protein